MNNFKKHIESSKLARETNSILEKYFAKEDIASFIEKIKPYLTDLQDLKPKSNGSSHDQVFFSDKLRLISDRLVTLAERKLEGTKYFEFLLEFGKLLITEGENELAFEMFELILNNTVPDPNTDSLRGYSLLGLADVYSRQARWKESVSNIRKARTIFEKSYDSHGLGKCEFYMGSILVEKGDLDAAKVRFEHSLTYLIPEKDKMLVGMIEVNLGIIQFIEGDLDSAHKHYVSGLQIFEELEDHRRIAEVKHNIGMIHAQKKKYDEALIEYNESIKLSLNGRYLPMLGITYLNKAQIYTEVDSLELASSFANKAMEISYQLNDKLTIADVYKIKGIITRKKKEFELSEDYLLTSRRINKELKNDLNYAETSYELGLLYNQSDSREKAKPYFLDAMHYYKKINSKQEISKISVHLN